jgi:CelD/BcsL family acetyltransferase involved in cellulose biosynthesis
MDPALAAYDGQFAQILVRLEMLLLGGRLVAVEQQKFHQDTLHT